MLSELVRVVYGRGGVFESEHQLRLQTHEPTGGLAQC